MEFLDSVLVNPDVWLNCDARWERLHRPKGVDDVSRDMKAHFACFPFCSETDVEPECDVGTFKIDLERALDLVVAVDNDGPDGFFHAFCYGYFGRDHDSGVIEQLRYHACAYAVRFWEMPALRDMFIGSFTQFVHPDKTFDLYSCLEVMNNNSVGVGFRKTLQVEVHCLGFVLKCEICTLTLLRDGSVARQRGGDIGAAHVVYVARDPKHHYHALTRTLVGSSVPPRVPYSLSSSNHPIVSSHPTTFAQTPVLSGDCFPQPKPKSPTTEVDDDWGKPPPVNYDAHLRATWPETEQVLRSLKLYNGIWTDAQSLQHTNWIHRVRCFHFF